MLEMWKIVDPYFKTAAYYTDEEVTLDRERMQEHFRGVQQAKQVPAVIDGKETRVWRALVQADGHITEIYLTDVTKAFWLKTSLAYLEAHDRKVRVEVTAKEIKSPTDEKEKTHDHVVHRHKKIATDRNSEPRIPEPTDVPTF